MTLDNIFQITIFIPKAVFVLLAASIWMTYIICVHLHEDVMK